MKNMKKIISIILLTISISSVGAEERPIAMLKAEYEVKEHSKALNETDGELQESDMVYSYILQISQNASYYYDPQQYFIDSLLNDPKGKELYSQVTHVAMKEAGESGNYMEIRDKMDYKWGKQYRCKKDFDAGKIKVRDSNIGDRFRYEVDMGDLTWELKDSVRTIIGYDCYLATADYHGRIWNAWFSPDIPVQDGPWQLCGLPGLIMEASTVDGDYWFKIKGIQKSNEELKDPFNGENDFITNRKAFLRMKHYSREHRAEHISAYTGGLVSTANFKRWKYFVDFIETDYHE